MMFAMNGVLKALPGKRDELLDYLLQAAREMDRMEACRCYIVGTNDQEQDHVYVYEVWESEAAHHASLTNPVVQNLIKTARPIIAGIQSFPSLSIHGGKGIERINSCR
jgi:quinol monooxygenase YgiN